MAKQTTPPVKVKLDEKNPEPVEIIAKAIIDIDAGIKKVLSSSLKKRAIMLLIKDASGVSYSNIEKVLNALDNLRSTYVK